ncbi:MAG: S-layer homology domain-containing protein [Bacillota bacterium]|nr:S-layer homology domain-containing protein [Bacillota bacterium]
MSIPPSSFTLYAIWDTPYTVSYDPNADTGTVPPDEQHFAGDSFSVPDPWDVTAPEGMQLKEWNTSPDGSGDSYNYWEPVIMPASNLTLYAIWETLQNGSEEFPYLVSNYDDFEYYLRYYYDSHIHQTADIVLPDPDDARSGYPDGCNWDPVELFTGSYDGGGYKISHLVINSGELLSAGLFGNVGEDAELKNINLTDVNIVTWSSGYVGALAAYNEGTIENCSVSGIISCPGYSVVGGIAGSNSGMIKNCSTSGIIEGREYCTVSGISGHNGGTIENCSASGVITGGEFCIVGGINGYNLGTITACTTNGNFSGFSNCEIGGITGSNAGVIADSTAYCCLPDRSDSNIGGIVGSNREEFGGTITNCTDNTSRASAETLYFVMNEEEGKFYIGNPGEEDEAGVPAGCTYDSESGILTLDNFSWKTFSPRAMVIIFDGENNSLTIDLAPGSENTLTSLFHNRYIDYESCGLEVEGNLYVEGTGTLIVQSGVTDSAEGIYVRGDLQINGGTVTAFAGDAIGYVNSSYGIYAGDMIISGGTVTAVAGDAIGYSSFCYGICTNDDITISGGTVTAAAGKAIGEASCSAGISVYTAVISGGTVTAAAGDVIGEGSNSIGISALTADISGGTVTVAAGDAIGEGSFSKGISAYTADISGGTVTIAAGDAIGEGSDSIGINVNTATVSGGTITVTGDTQAVATESYLGGAATIDVDIAEGYRYWTNTVPSATGAAGPVSSAAAPFVNSDTYKYIRIAPGLGNEETPVSPPSPSSQSPSPSYSANVSDGGNIPVMVNTGTGSASIDLDSLSERLADGGNTIVSVPPISGISSYTAVLPATSLSGSNEGTMTISTGAGSVTIPGNMLAGTGLTGDAGITIGSADPSSLPESIQTAIGSRPLISLALTIDGRQVEWSNPDAPVTVSIPYTPTAEELLNPESIVIWYVDGSGNVTCVPNGRFDPASGTVTFTTTHFSYYAVSYKLENFNDVPKDAWYYDAVSFIAARDITTGTGGGNFSPDAKLTRGQFIVMLMRAYGIEPDVDPDPKDNFADAGNAYYTGYLAAAKRLGISNGTGNNMYSPLKEITRQEMFTLLYNALKVTGQLPAGDSGNKLSDFSDADKIASWAYEAMKLLVETGMISGSGGKLAPTATTTRAEMAQVLYNLLNR